MRTTVVGAVAVSALAEGREGVMVALDQTAAKLKHVLVDGHGVLTVRTMDISFGD